MVAGDSGCSRSEGCYMFRLDSGSVCGFMTFLAGNVFPLGIGLYRIQDERCAWQQWPGRSCGGKICFSPSLTLHFTGWSWQGACGIAGIMVMDWATREVYGDRGNMRMAWVTAWPYLVDCGVDWHYLIIQHTIQVFIHCTWSPLHFSRFHRSMQCVWFLTSGYQIVSSHPLGMLLKPDMIVHTN